MYWSASRESHQPSVIETGLLQEKEELLVGTLLFKARSQDTSRQLAVG